MVRQSGPQLNIEWPPVSGSIGGELSVDGGANENAHMRSCDSIRVVQQRRAPWELLLQDDSSDLT